MAEALRIFTALRSHSIYPKQGHEFTEFEAFVDLALHAYPKGVVLRSLQEMATQWSWTKSAVNRFMQYLAQQKLIQRTSIPGQWILSKSDKWYDLPVERRDANVANAKLVIDIFNQVFKRKVIANDYRIRTVAARIRENKATPDVFKKVFEFKLREWGQDEEMKKYLTLETLCARKHFQKYFEQAQEARRTQDGGQRISGSIMQAR